MPGQLNPWLPPALMAKDQEGKQPFNHRRRSDAQINRCSRMGVTAKKGLPALLV